MIKLEKVTKKYGSFLALDEVSFSIKKGKVTALLGPNGAGKTTCMRILTGFLEPSSGTVKVNGRTLSSSNRFEIQKNIGYLPENAPLYPELNVWEHLEFSAKIHGIADDQKDKAIKKAAELCGLLDKIYFNISELSKGYKQRVGLAQAIVHDPDILILDEPTTGLDPNQILEIRDLILSWKSDKTILLSTHIMQEVEALADEVVIINRGKVVKETSKSDLKKVDTESEEVFVIRVEIDGHKKDIAHAEKHLKKQTEIGSISVSGNVLLIEASIDCRPQIARAIVTQNLDLREISLQKSSVEEVFTQLTQE